MEIKYEWIITSVIWICLSIKGFVIFTYHFFIYFHHNVHILSVQLILYSPVVFWTYRFSIIFIRTAHCIKFLVLMIKAPLSLSSSSIKNLWTFNITLAFQKSISEWQRDVYSIFTRTSIASGGATSISSITKGFPASQATAARFTS